MTSRERIWRIFNGETADRCGFWMGNPDGATWPIYFDYFKVADEESLRRKLNDDFRWICPQWTSYQHPEGKQIFAWERHSLGEAGPLANAESIEELDALVHWPEVQYLNFSDTLTQLDAATDWYRASGMWSCFFHNVMDLFGIEEYFVKMHTHPELVEEVTRRVCQFYYDANEIFFAQAKGKVDAFFFGNDFGTQIDLFMSPEFFDRFVMGWFRKFTEQGHNHGLQVILHSCGAISRVIGRLIDSDVDALHPLQARAAGMDAESLARQFKGKIAFVGGIDTQHLLVHGTPADIKAEVRRVRNLLGPSLVISPSHEALLPNVPPQNVLAMAEEAVFG